MSGLKAISGNVFVIRDERETSCDGIEISDGAAVKSLNGTVAFADCDLVKPGDRVHIPHYGVQDMEYGGTEYAMFKAERLFFANGEPINGYALVRKCEEDHVRDEHGEIALYMTEKHIESTNWVEILDVAGDCKTLSKRYKGMFSPLPENDERLARLGNSKDFCAHESLVPFLTEG